MRKEVVDRLSKLIARLASNHDGEVLATVAAIKRVLAANAYDLNDLAASISVEQAARPKAADKQYADAIDIFNALDELREYLSESQERFVEGVYEFFQKRTRITTRQRDVLLDILARAQARRR